MQEHATVGKGSVNPVTGDRMSEAGKMHSNLVRAAGANPDLEIGELIEPLADPIFGEGLAPGGQAGGLTGGRAGGMVPP